ncbi:tyrosine recombinase XerS [Metabacillus sp. SLBN-84]
MPIQSRQRIIHEKRLDSHLPSLPDYVIEYILSKKRAGYSSSTLLGYVHEYIKFFSWLQEQGISKVADIKDIPYTVLAVLSKENVEFYIDYLQEEDIRTEKEVNAGLPVRTRSSQAVYRNVNALKSLFNYLTQETENEDGECYFYRNVFSKIKQKKEQETSKRRAKKINSTVLTTEEINELLDFIKFDYEKDLSGRKLTSFLKQKERDIAIISMLLGSGVRVGEIASLTLTDIDFKEEEIDIIRKGSKEDTADVLPSALEDLKDYLSVRKERFKTKNTDVYVFVTNYAGKIHPISVRSIQNMVSSYTKAFKIKYDEFYRGNGLSPHKLRHTFATDWINKGGNIVLLRDQLGHSSIETTSKYTNLSKKEGKKVMNAIEETRASNVNLLDR